jgi:hypothetical protein
MKDGSNRRPDPMPLVLTVTVSGLTPGVAYRLYRYDELEKIPDSGFNAHASAAAQIRDIQISSGSHYTFRQDILSNEVAAYRCVRAP